MLNNQDLFQVLYELYDKNKNFLKYPEEEYITLALKPLLESFLEINEVLLISYFEKEKKEENYKNKSGDIVKKLDLISNNILINNLSKSSQYFAISSEELNEIYYCNDSNNGNWIISLDPLDGSSNIDSNQTIGTIFGIYKNDKDLFYQNKENLVLSGYFLYGTRKILVISNRFGTFEFSFHPHKKKWMLCNLNMQIPSEANTYIVNESYSIYWNSKIQEYILSLKKRGFNLRYSGTLVSDIHYILKKGGVFLYPPNKKNIKGKLRLLYEIIPLSFLIENAGGISKEIKLNDKNKLEITNIGDIRENLHEKSGIIIGSKNLVEGL